MQLNKILLTADLSAVSGLSVPHAIALGRQFGAAIDVMHVVKGADGPPPPDVRTSLEVELSPITAPLAAFDVTAQAVFGHGDPIAALVGATPGCDLVITTKHGEGVSSGRVGSVSQKLAERSIAPVMVVPGRVPEGGINTEPPAYETLVVPTDFSPDSAKAIEATVALARAVRASVVVVHVVSAPQIGVHVDGDEVRWAALNPRLEDLVEARRLELAEFVHEPDDVPMEEVVVVCADPGEGIVAAAIDAGGDVICMPSHGQGWLQTLLMGNVTDSVLKQTRMPVIVMRREWLQGPGRWGRGS